ncbi:MAG: hypothetical protein KDD33_06695 [Bdellovibrionales bacterium]|nr:hypothetical protein [Bdellovibrionales bacterium]
MSEAKKLKVALKEIGSGNDVEAYAKLRTSKTSTEIQLSNHLEGLLKDGLSIDGAAEETGKSVLSYGHTILAAVVYEKYDTANAELEILLELRQDYPEFGHKAGQYIQHAKSLIKAIKAKRSIGKLPSVSRAKQKELINALGFHFKELRLCLINIEKIERHIRREDMSSTRWFVLTVYWSLFAVFLTAMLLYVLPDTLRSFYTLIVYYLDVGLKWVAHYFWPF